MKKAAEIGLCAISSLIRDASEYESCIAGHGAEGDGHSCLNDPCYAIY